MFRKMRAHIEIRRCQILTAFQRKLAMRKIGALALNWRRQNPAYLSNKIRSSISCAVGLKVLSLSFVWQAKQQMSGFLLTASKKFYLHLKFRKFFSTITKTQARLSYVCASRRQQMQLLKKMFEYQKNMIIQKLITQIEKPKKKKKSKALIDPVDAENESKKLSDKAEMHLEWKQQITSLDTHKMFSTLMGYLDMCRHIHRQDFDDLRRRWSLERTNEAERAVMSELELIQIEGEGLITVPPDYLMIYAF